MCEYVCRDVAEFRRRYKEHYARVRDEFPRDKTADEKLMDEQHRQLHLIDDFQANDQLSAKRADEARARVLAGDLSGFELDDNAATRKWLKEQDRQRKLGLRLFHKHRGSREDRPVQRPTCRAMATVRARPRERRATSSSHLGSRGSPDRPSDSEPPLDGDGWPRLVEPAPAATYLDATAEEGGWLSEVDAEVSRYQRKRRTGGWYHFEPPEGRAA